jgi:hypothetical protein
LKALAILQPAKRKSPFVALLAAVSLLATLAAVAPRGVAQAGERERAGETPFDDALFIAAAPPSAHRVVLRESAKPLPALLPSSGRPPAPARGARGEVVAPSSLTLPFVVVVPRSPRGPPAA